MTSRAAPAVSVLATPVTADPAPTVRDAALRVGARAVLPYAAGLAPFGLVIGAAADRSEVGGLLGWSTAWLVYGGSAQIALIRMLDAGAAPLAVVVTVAMVNLRLLAYATVLAPVLHTAGRLRTVVACYLVLDPVYVVTTDAGRLADVDLAWRRRHYLGAGAAMWVAWVTACGVGTLLGPDVTAVLPVGTVVDLVLVAMVAMVARDRSTGAAAVAGFAVGLPASVLPAGTGPVVAGMLVIAVAALPTGRRSRP